MPSSCRLQLALFASLAHDANQAARGMRRRQEHDEDVDDEDDSMCVCEPQFRASNAASIPREKYVPKELLLAWPDLQVDSFYLTTPTQRSNDLPWFSHSKHGMSKIRADKIEKKCVFFQF